MIPQQADLSPFTNAVFAESAKWYHPTAVLGVLHALPAARCSVYSALLCSFELGKIPKRVSSKKISQLILANRQILFLEPMTTLW